MASNDPGMNAEPNGIEESISNLSGDTLLLADDDTMVEDNENVHDGNDDNGNVHNANDDDNIFTYADVLRRENATPAEVTPGSVIDNEEAYLGHGRVLTNFERTHFHRDNVTPGRPCTAYFNSEYFVDSKAVFDKLKQLDIPRESVLCLQRRPSGDMVITFTNEHVKKKFVSNVVIRFRESLSVINDEDMPLTFLNVYDAPYELSDEALTFRLRQYCIVHSTRRGKLARSHVNNGIRHFRVQILQPLPSYLRFGKFLVRLSHDGQQHTCRRCNRGGHFANECRNVVCFNCDELGHQSKECGGPVLCCICKSPDHRARHCRFAWHRSTDVSAPSSSNRDPGSGGHVAASAGDPPPSSCDPASGGDVTAPASGLVRSSTRDPASGGDVTAPASDPVRPVRSAARVDFLRNLFSPSSSDSALFSAAGTASQSSDSPSGFGVLDDNGLLRWENIAFRGHVPNPPGPQSSGEELVSTAEQSADQPAVVPSGTPVVPSADPPNVSADLANATAVSSDFSVSLSDVSTDPPVPAVSSDVPVDSPAHLPVDQSTDSPVVPPVIVVDDPSTDSTDASVPDLSASSPAPLSGKNRTSALPRRKPAPMPEALEAVARRPTRPTLPVSGKSGKSGTSVPPSDENPEDMDAHSNLKRKQVANRRKGDPKKGKH